MNIIVAVDDNWGIGKDGDLLVKLPGDMQYFKNKTFGKSIIIGRKTLDSFPDGKPLPNRHNIVLTHDRKFEKEDCLVFNYISDIMEYVKALPSEDVFVCGGGSIYKQFFPFCDTFYVTHILESYDDVDTYFVNLDDESDISLVWQSDIRDENGILYYFAKYERISN